VFVVVEACFENHSVAGVNGSFAYMLGSIAGIYGSFVDISGACTSAARLVVQACFENHSVCSNRMILRMIKCWAL